MLNSTYDSAILQPARSSWLSRRLPLGLTISTIVLTGIILFALFLHFYNLSAVGSGNLYYTAAVESMLQSWSNFFFVAAEPGGSVTVDKPPLGLWIQAISAFFLGVSGVSVVLPQIIAGVLSIPLLYWLVKRWFGDLAGLLAAFALTITPIFAATNRNNTMDSTLLFTLLLAAWAFMKATDTGKARWLLIGAALVGIGFNIKMLQAFLPLPAFYALYFLGSSEGWLRKIANLIAATVLMLIIAFSWVVVVDAIPADQRPYIGSSQNNTVMELVFGHNGASRLFSRGRGNMPAGGMPQGGRPINGQQPIAGQLPPNGTMPNPPQGMGPTSQGGPGGETGEPGAWRMFTTPLSNEAAWLLPFGLLAIGLVITGTRLQFPLAPAHRGLVLWGGWLVTCLVFFSMAGLFHAYYLIMIAPPLAALVGMGLVRLWRLYENKPLLSAAALISLVALTLAFQSYTAYQYVQSTWWIVPTMMIAGTGAVMLAANIVIRQQVVAMIGTGALVAAVLVTPLIWSVLTISEMSPNVALPNAYEGEVTNTMRPATGSGVNVDETLLAYLQDNTRDTEYLMAVQSSMQGASYVIITGRSVLYMGGFSGGDPVVSVADLQQMVANGELRYILWGDAPQNNQNVSEIGQWLQQSCQAVREVASQGNRPMDQQSGQPPASILYQCSN